MLLFFFFLWPPYLPFYSSNFAFYCSPKVSFTNLSKVIVLDFSFSAFYFFSLSEEWLSFPDYESSSVSYLVCSVSHFSHKLIPVFLRYNHTPKYTVSKAKYANKVKIMQTMIIQLSKSRTFMSAPSIIMTKLAKRMAMTNCAIYSPIKTFGSMLIFSKLYALMRIPVIRLITASTPIKYSGFYRESTKATPNIILRINRKVYFGFFGILINTKIG